MFSSRRRFVELLGTAGGAVLAGCTTFGGGGEHPGTAATTETTTDTPTGTPTHTTTDPQAWPMFQHDRHNGGHADTAGPTEGATQEWRNPDLLPEDSRIRAGSAPAVVEDTVFFGCWDDNVYALSAVDGSVEWRHEVGDAAYSSPAVVDDTVYVGYRGPLLYALSADDGSEQWRFETGRETPAAAVVDDTVYVGSGDTVYALATADGEPRWRYETGPVETAPAVADRTVYIGTGVYTAPPPTDCEKGRGCRDEPRPRSPHSHSVTALSAEDGSVEWRYKTGDVVASSPAVVDGTVYVGSTDGHVYALSASDGAEEWAFETVRGVTSSPAVADGTVYVGSNDQQVYALKADDGTEQWRYETDGRDNRSPAVADDTVYVFSRVQPPDDGPMANGYVHALSAQEGTDEWTFKVATPMGAPAVVDGKIYLGPLALG